MNHFSFLGKSNQENMKKNSIQGVINWTFKILGANSNLLTENFTMNWLLLSRIKTMQQKNCPDLERLKSNQINVENKINKKLLS